MPDDRGADRFGCVQLAARNRTVTPRVAPLSSITLFSPDRPACRPGVRSEMEVDQSRQPRPSPGSRASRRRRNGWIARRASAQAAAMKGLSGPRSLCCSTQHTALPSRKIPAKSMAQIFVPAPRWSVPRDWNVWKPCRVISRSQPARRQAATTGLVSENHLAPGLFRRSLLRRARGPVLVAALIAPRCGSRSTARAGPAPNSWSPGPTISRSGDYLISYRVIWTIRQCSFPAPPPPIVWNWRPRSGATVVRLFAVPPPTRGEFAVRLLPTRTGVAFGGKFCWLGGLKAVARETGVRRANGHIAVASPRNLMVIGWGRKLHMTRLRKHGGSGGGDCSHCSWSRRRRKRR